VPKSSLRLNNLLWDFPSISDLGIGCVLKKSEKWDLENIWAAWYGDFVK
jgi:hypothetical protein